MASATSRKLNPHKRRKEDIMEEVKFIECRKCEKLFRGTEKQLCLDCWKKSCFLHIVKKQSKGKSNYYFSCHPYAVDNE